MNAFRFTLAVAATLIAVQAPLASAQLYPPDTTLTREPTPDIARPGYLEPITDPTFGTTITRIADEEAFGQEGFGEIRHAYAKNQTWNSDGTLLMLNWRYPAPLLDGETYERIGRVHQPSEAVWMNTDPRFAIGVSRNRLVRWDMVEDRRDGVIERFEPYREVILGAGEGNLSNDDRFAALFGVRDDRTTDVLVYDIEERRVVGRRTYERSGVGDGANALTFNNVTMAQSGERVVIEFNERGIGPREGIQSYELDFGDRVPLSRNGGTHYDTCVDTEGEDTIVTGANGSSAIVSVDLTDGTKTELLPETLVAYSIHVSCRNIARPGWAYISEYFDSDAPRLANFNEILAVRLDGSGTVERFAHEHHSRNEAYEREPHAVPNPDGSKVLWASDWDRPRAPVYAYVAEQR